MNEQPAQPYPVHWEADVVLRDGGIAHIRPIGPDDAGRLVHFYEKVSDESKYYRFFAPYPRLSDRDVHRFTHHDYDDRVGLAATIGDEFIATVRYDRIAEDGRPAAPGGASTRAEVAFLVQDAHQGRGVASALLEHIAAVARERGILHFIAEVLPANRKMVKVFTDAGYTQERSFTDGVVHLELDLEPTTQSLQVMRAREHRAEARSVQRLLRPSSVAVVGTGRRPGGVGRTLLRNITAGGFTGRLYAVNHSFPEGGTAVDGVPGHRSVAAIGEPVDLAVIAVPADRVPEAVADCGEAGVRGLVVVAAGYSESGAEGREKQRELVRQARSHGMRVIGPNAFGVLNTAADIRLNASLSPEMPHRGRLGLFTQSGSIGIALLSGLHRRGAGPSSFVSAGNRADVSGNDLLQFWETDPDTDLVLLYLESFGNPRAFARIARRVARAKPILAMKSGTTSAGRKAASSHTAALAGSDAAVDALFRQAGVIRTATLDELVDVAALLSAQPVPRGRRVAVVTNAGGLGILCADACESAGLELPALAESTREKLAEVLPAEASVANPVDMLGGSTHETYRRALPIVLDDPGVDAVIVLFVPVVGVDEELVGEAISRAARESSGDKTVLCTFLSHRGAPSSLRSAAAVPDFDYPEAAARALGRAADRGDWLHRPAGVVPELDVDHDGARQVILADGDRWLEPADARRLLESYGLPVVPERFAGTADEAVAAAEELGYPVVVKTAAAGAHKTESGGVALNLADAADVRAAVERIGGRVLIQPMVRGGAELLAGAVQDPMFGPLVAFGAGGVFAELIGQAQFRLAPLTDIDAHELVRDGKAGTLVRGYRGNPPADEEALVDLLLRLSQLAADHPEVAELDLNPVLALPDGAVAVDARVRIAHPQRAQREKTW